MPDSLRGGFAAVAATVMLLAAVVDARADDAGPVLFDPAKVLTVDLTLTPEASTDAKSGYVASAVAEIASMRVDLNEPAQQDLASTATRCRVEPAAVRARASPRRSCRLRGWRT